MMHYRATDRVYCESTVLTPVFSVKSELELGRSEVLGEADFVGDGGHDGPFCLKPWWQRGRNALPLQPACRDPRSHTPPGSGDPQTSIPSGAARPEVLDLHFQGRADARKGVGEGGDQRAVAQIAERHGRNGVEQRWRQQEPGQRTWAPAAVMSPLGSDVAAAIPPPFSVQR